jgi:AhpD family alkylhydroperoxidase
MRIDYKRRPEIVGPMRSLGQAAREGPLEPLLIELVKIRASQLNGCGHCLEMHTKDARALGESEDRLHLVAAWRDAPVFSERERAALVWCEELTLLAERNVDDETYDAVRRVFTDDELCQLTLAVVTINAWNRFAVAFRAPVGNYVSRVAAAEARP